MDSLQGVWLWASVVSILLVLGIIGSWLQLAKNSQGRSYFSWIAALGLFMALGYQCSHGISLISSISILLLPMSFALLILTLVLNIKLKTPLLILMANPLVLLLMLAGIRLTDKIETHSKFNDINIHIFIVMMGFLFIFLSSMVSSVLLLQALRLKRKIHFKIKLPSLDFLERVVRSLNNLSLLLLTLGIGAGDMYVRNHRDLVPADWPDSTFYWTISTWGLLFILSILHFNNRISGSRFAWCNFIILIAAIITLLGRSHG